MNKKIYGLVALALAATPSFATDLWNQQVSLPASPNQFGAAIDSVLTDLPADSSYQLSDVEVGAGGWLVNSISMEVQDNSPSAAAANGVTQAVLNLFPNAGTASPPLSTNDPTTGSTVSVTMSLVAGYTNVYLMTASGLNLNLNPGEYWVGLTGIGSFSGPAGEIFAGYGTTGSNANNNLAGANAAGALQESYVNNPGGGFFPAGWNPTGGITGDPYLVSHVYSAIDIQGSSPAPEPASMAFLGLGVLGVIGRRRSRK